jgi:hypothetical protein
MKIIKEGNATRQSLRVLVRRDRIASIIVNANHSIM